MLSLVGHVPFEANLLRFQGLPYLVEGGTVRNQFELHRVLSPSAWTAPSPRPWSDSASGEVTRMEARFPGPARPSR